MRLLLAVTLLASPLAAQVVPDSVLTAWGCITAPPTEAHQDSIALDSAGIRVIIKRGSSGAVDSLTGFIRWCPTREIVIAFPRDTVWLSDGRPFVRRDSSASLWVRDTNHTNFSYVDWQSAVRDLAPPAVVIAVPPSVQPDPPVVVQPPVVAPNPPTATVPPAAPVVVPPVVIVPPVVVLLPPVVVLLPPTVSADACNAAPWHWQTLADGTRKRDDTMTAQCRAIVTLTDAGRYAVAYAPCGLGQWTYHPTLYVTRASAVLRAKNPPACSGAP